MSEKEFDGLMVSNEDGVYFIPSTKLGQYKVADAAAASISDALADEVSGFKWEQAEPVKEAPGFRPIQFGFSGRIRPVTLGLQYSDMPTAT